MTHLTAHLIFRLERRCKMKSAISSAGKLAIKNDFHSERSDEFLSLTRIKVASQFFCWTFIHTKYNALGFIYWISSRCNRATFRSSVKAGGKLIPIHRREWSRERERGSESSQMADGMFNCRHLCCTAVKSIPEQRFCLHGRPQKRPAEFPCPTNRPK